MHRSRTAHSQETVANYARHRRAAAARRGSPLPHRPRPLRRRHRSARRACTACSCARRTPMRAFARSMRRRRCASPGVVAVFTGADMAADGMAPMRPLWAIRSRDGSPMAEPPRFALARDTVRHVGEPVAAVIAETLAAGGRRGRTRRHRLRAAARRDRRARRAGARTRRNCMTLRPATSASAGRAAMRPRCARRFARPRTPSRSISSTTAWSAPRSSRARSWPRLSRAPTSSRSIPRRRRRITSAARSTEQLGIPESALRVISPDVGGGFGYKGKLYPEERHHRLGGATARAGRCAGWRAAPRASSPTTRRAITSRMPSSRSTRDGHFLALARANLRQSRRLCLDLRRGYSERDL